MLKLDSSDIICPYNEDSSLNKEGSNLFQLGSETLKNNNLKLGVVILSGGDGTRLGFNLPKGLFPVNNKPLFFYHLKRIENICIKYNIKVNLFVITNKNTQSCIQEYFSKLNLPFIKDQPIIIAQDHIETLDKDTKMPMFLNKKNICNPKGNGDFYNIIKRAKGYEDVDVFNVTSVDNILSNLLDEVYIGAFVKNNLEVLSKVIEPRVNEKVGSFCKENGKIMVKEYSEIVENGILLDKSYGNICNHMFSRSFIEKVDTNKMKYHEAIKKVPYTNEEGQYVNPDTPNAIKRELFIFDAFQFADSNKLLLVNRKSEFSPLKNSVNNSVTDNLDTCMLSLKENNMLKMDEIKLSS